MFRILILEDEPKHAEMIMRCLKTYEWKHPEMELSVQHYDRPLALLSEYKRNVDLLLLDIRTPDMLGIELARKIRAIDEEVMIIFITSMVQYAVDGYAVQAFDYMMKPFTMEDLHAKLDRAFRVLEKKRQNVFLEVRSKTDVRRIAADDITFIEVANHDVLVHLHGETVRQWGSLKDCESQLQQAHFVRCNACYLVNLQYVRALHGETVVVDGSELTISRSRRKEFLSCVAQYKGGSR